MALLRLKGRVDQVFGSAGEDGTIRGLVWLLLESHVSVLENYDFFHLQGWKLIANAD